jgi:predicted metal-dependent enzyme (double-stranded beta helix superfamily)
MNTTITAPLTAEAAAAEMIKLPSVDWSDLEQAAETTRQIALRIGDDHALLRALVDRAAVVPQLREKCEIHTLDDKIVIWDEQDRGLRIRLRLANTTQYERVHNHRFSFTAYLLSGTYYHTLYATDQPLDETADVTRFWPRSVREERTGDIITLHHQQLHTTLTAPDTISLMIQSPAQKRRAFMIRRSDGEVWWRVGAADEDEARRREVRMSDERLDYWRQRLAELGVC